MGRDTHARVVLRADPLVDSQELLVFMKLQTIGNIKPTILSAIIMYGAVIGARNSMFADTSAVWRLILMVLVGMVVYSCMTIVFNKKTLIRTLNLFKVSNH